MRRRIVVTGMGAVTPIGLNVDEYWQGLCEGRCGVGLITQFDTTRYPVKIAAEVKGFDPVKFMNIKRVDRTARCTHLAVPAAKMAIADAKLDMSREKPERVGVAVGTTGMPSLVLDQADNLKYRGPMRIDPLMLSKIAAHAVPVQVAMEIGARGPNTSLNSACATGSDVLGMALNLLRLGHADVMVAGGGESQVNPLAMACLGLVGALSRNPDPKTACQPFDLNRSGMVMGEGAGFLVLETYEHAAGRGAAMLAELAGAGWTFDCFSDTAPNAETEAVAMQMALQDGGVSPQEVDYINAHGTSTRLNDATETRALKLMFGERAYKIPVSSNKSMIGHLACAAGAVEAIASVLTIVHGVIPPTINYETPDPECDLDYVPNKARRQIVNTVLSNSFGMGGQNACIVLKRIS